jgi:hypothetical protein
MEKQVLKTSAAALCGRGPVYSFTALLIKDAAAFGWADSTLIIARREDYDNRGNFEGVPVFVIGPADLPRVQPVNVFDLLNGGNITDKVAGVIDWETRISWLEAFTDEEKRAAVQIEKHLQTLESSNAA